MQGHFGFGEREGGRNEKIINPLCACSSLANVYKHNLKYLLFILELPLQSLAPSSLQVA